MKVSFDEILKNTLIHQQVFGIISNTKEIPYQQNAKSL